MPLPDHRLGIAYIGSFNAIFSCMFPNHYDAHVDAYRAHLDLQRRIRRYEAQRLLDGYAP